MAWLRLDDGVVDNPKVQMLSPVLFRAWINCLCIAKKHNGQLPDMKLIGYRLRIPESRAGQMVEELISAGLFERRNGEIVPHDWNDWQFQSDVSTSRVKQFRERQKAVTRNGDETFHETHQNRTEQNIPPKPPERVPKYTQEFERFWGEYPRKIGKGEAFSAWQKRRFSLETQERIMGAVSAAKLSFDWKKEGGKFIPHPATWLNGARWDDELKAPTAANGDIQVW